MVSAYPWMSKIGVSYEVREFNGQPGAVFSATATGGFCRSWSSMCSTAGFRPSAG